MKMIKWMAMAALLCGTGCDQNKTATEAAEEAHERSQEVTEVKQEAAKEVAELKREAAEEVAEVKQDAKEEVDKITKLDDPIAEGVEPGFAYTEVVELKTDAAGGGKQRDIKLWVNELTPAQGMEKLGAQLKMAGFTEAVDKGSYKHMYVKDDQTIGLNHTDFAPGDARGLGMVDVTVITK
jgi:hypothetical protein